MDVYDIWDRLIFMKTSCCMNVKFYKNRIMKANEILVQKVLA